MNSGNGLLFSIVFKGNSIISNEASNPLQYQFNHSFTLDSNTQGTYQFTGELQ